MMKNSCFNAFLPVLLVLAAPAFAAPAAADGNGLQKNKPIEISSDKLDVYQPEHKAIFSGNVIAIQGTTNMRAATMTVFYRDSQGNGTAKKPEAAPAEPAAAPAAPDAQGIYRIEAQTGVVFTTPTETAIGDTAIYNVDSDTIDLTGANVTLTRGQNVLKGNHLNYNMATGRSVLTAANGGTTVSGEGSTGGKGARVHGLFIPKGDEKGGSK